MPDALSRVATRSTAQTQRVLGRPEQVKNSAGGYVFKTSDAARLHRFLTLGTEGGTYYVGQDKLTKDNAEFLIQLVQGRAENVRVYTDQLRGPAKDNRQRIMVTGAAREELSRKFDAAVAFEREILTEIVEISQAGRAPRNNPALFALAVVASYGSDSTRSAAFDVLPRVARTSTHLFQFIEYVKQFRGWGRALHRGISDWYTQPEVGKVEYQTVKYRQREGWTHRDVLRKVKPKVQGPRNELFGYLTGRADADLSELPMVRAFEEAKAATTPGEWLPILTRTPGMTWEMLPDAALNDPLVWTALVRNGGGLPQTALMRQLPRLTRLGLIGPLDTLTPLVVEQLKDPERLRKARVHPINILVALKTYEQGRGMRGQSTWEPSAPIIDALNDAFYAAYATVEPAGKRTMLALDVSGSMSSSAGGLPVSCCEVTAALSLVVANTEPAHMIFGFADSSNFAPLKISPKQRIMDAVRETQKRNFGGTDCALPMLYAKQKNLQVDTFIVMTDSETYAGRSHPFQALKDYRTHSGIDAKMIVVGMTATDFTIADPSDAGSMDIAGFDSAVPTLITDFSAGRI